MRKILIFAILLFGGWFAWSQWEQNARLRAKNAKLESDLMTDESKLSGEARAEKKLIAGLERQRAAEQVEIARLSNDLHSAQSLGFDHGFQTHEREERQKRMGELQDLQAGLAQVRAQEQDLQSGGKQARAASQADEKATREALVQQIHDLNDKIQGEKSQIAQLRKARFDPDAQNRASAMEADLSTDQQTLGTLKSSRDQTGVAFGATRAQSDAQNRDALGQARQSETSIKAQIESEKAAIKQLDQSLGQESKSEKDTQSIQAQLKAGIAQHQAKVTELDTRIREETAKLEAIGGQ